MPRTDFTSEIDGALAGRNLGSRHWSDVARSGNGNMLSDLSEEELGDYQELDGIGEGLEELSLDESNAVCGLGGVFKKFRALKIGEQPPFVAKPNMSWMRKRIPTAQRKPGGGIVARTKWVQMTGAKMQKLQGLGEIAGFGDIPGGVGLWASAGVGILGGFAAWFLFMRKKK